MAIQWTISRQKNTTANRQWTSNGKYYLWWVTRAHCYVSFNKICLQIFLSGFNVFKYRHKVRTLFDISPLFLDANMRIVLWPPFSFFYLYLNLWFIGSYYEKQILWVREGLSWTLEPFYTQNSSINDINLTSQRFYLQKRKCELILQIIYKAFW